MNEHHASLIAELILSITANTMATKELASQIRNQSDAIDDLVNVMSEQDVDDNESDTLGHLGHL